MEIWLYNKVHGYMSHSFNTPLYTTFLTSHTGNTGLRKIVCYGLPTVTSVALGLLWSSLVFFEFMRNNVKEPKSMVYKVHRFRFALKNIATDNVVLRMSQQLYCRSMSNNVERSNVKEWIYSKKTPEFPSNSNRYKKNVDGIGPGFEGKYTKVTIWCLISVSDIWR